jgi:hypothetical protein
MRPGVSKAFKNSDVKVSMILQTGHMVASSLLNMDPSVSPEILFQPSLNMTTGTPLPTINSKPSLFLTVDITANGTVLAYPTFISTISTPSSNASIVNRYPVQFFLGLTIVVLFSAAIIGGVWNYHAAKANAPLGNFEVPDIDVEANLRPGKDEQRRETEENGGKNMGETRAVMNDAKVWKEEFGEMGGPAGGNGKDLEGKVEVRRASFEDGQEEGKTSLGVVERVARE